MKWLLKGFRREWVRIPKSWRVAGLVAIGATGVDLGFYFHQFGGRDTELSTNTEEWGRFGEYVGGTLGPLFAILAFGAAVYAVTEQRMQARVDEVQRLLMGTSHRIAELLGRDPPNITPMAAQQLQPNGALDSMRALLEYTGRRLQWSADPDVQEIFECVVTVLRMDIRSDVLRIVIELQHLVYLLKEHEVLGGPEMIRQHYVLLYAEIVAALHLLELLGADPVREYFQPEELIKRARAAAEAEERRAIAALNQTDKSL